MWRAPWSLSRHVPVVLCIASRFVLQPPDFNPYSYSYIQQCTQYFLFPHLRPLPYTCLAKHLLLSSLQQLSPPPFIRVYTLTAGAHPQHK